MPKISSLYSTLTVGMELSLESTNEWISVFNSTSLLDQRLFFASTSKVSVDLIDLCISKDCSIVSSQWILSTYSSQWILAIFSSQWILAIHIYLNGFLEYIRINELF